MIKLTNCPLTLSDNLNELSKKIVLGKHSEQNRKKIDYFSNFSLLAKMKARKKSEFSKSHEYHGEKITLFERRENDLQVVVPERHLVLSIES